MKKKTTKWMPKRGSVGDIKRQIAFENRTITPLKAIGEFIAIALFAIGFALVCAVA